ncbi:polyprenyl synthetase family protein [Williamwhitmania taraxaci]|uniref:Octaprenyl-diphosphate synthase n=1 Tax=Williamwhitmania taraxaci TaxID=1640674 RepID=A0A1G6GZJ8_9BACT|nr:polyprenyl synthetase family protein [Williamwhitmania taraxaci]SDB87452.1 octaprenyl-diphosphate synthase [Williamwhitmania taraxaci]
MSGIDNIKNPVRKELEEFEMFFRDQAKTPYKALDFILNYVIRRKGKQLRPLFVFLSAKASGEITRSTYAAAAMIELLHTATLIHDDVVDEAYERRGFWSINALWRSKVAVLVGDFILSKGLIMAVQHKEYAMLETMSNAVKEMSEGELFQMEKTRKMNITEQDYYDIIRKKTAVLISACTSSGARSAGASPEVVSRMEKVGELLGMAFQVKDDLLDFLPTGLTGKPSGNDIKEKKLTLPLIHALNQSTAAEKKAVVSRIIKTKRKRLDVDKIVAFVEQKGGIVYAQNKMSDFKEEALSLLQELPESESRLALEALANYIVNRKS